MEEEEIVENKMGTVILIIVMFTITMAVCYRTVRKRREVMDKYTKGNTAGCWGGFQWLKSCHLAYHVWV